MIFDPNAKNIAPMYLGNVKDGKVTFRRYTMEKPYATVGENGVHYAGPEIADAAGPELRRSESSDRERTALASTHARRPVTESAGIASDVPWGKASTELVKLVYDPGIHRHRGDRARAGAPGGADRREDISAGGGDFVRPGADLHERSLDFPYRAGRVAGGCGAVSSRGSPARRTESRTHPGPARFGPARGREMRVQPER